jgi:hypothetical protein
MPVSFACLRMVKAVGWGHCLPFVSRVGLTPPTAVQERPPAVIRADLGDDGGDGRAREHDGQSGQVGEVRSHASMQAAWNAQPQLGVQHERREADDTVWGALRQRCQRPRPTKLGHRLGGDERGSSLLDHTDPFRVIFGGRSTGAKTCAQHGRPRGRGEGALPDGQMASPYMAPRRAFVHHGRRR